MGCNLNLMNPLVIQDIIIVTNQPIITAMTIAKSSYGPIYFEVPRDWKVGFEPQLGKKNQITLSQNIEQKILSIIPKFFH